MGLRKSSMNLLSVVDVSIEISEHLRENRTFRTSIQFYTRSHTEQLDLKLNRPTITRIDCVRMPLNHGLDPPWICLCFCTQDEWVFRQTIFTVFSLDHHCIASHCIHRHSASSFSISLLFQCYSHCHTIIIIIILNAIAPSSTGLCTVSFHSDRTQMNEYSNALACLHLSAYQQVTFCVCNK